MHRLAARTGLASAAQTRTQTDDEATLEPAKVMEPTEEDDADDVDHEVDESSKKTCDSFEELGGAGRQLRWPCDDEDPYAPDAGDAGKETLRMMTMKSTMQSPRPASRNRVAPPSGSHAEHAPRWPEGANETHPAAASAKPKPL